MPKYKTGQEEKEKEKERWKYFSVFGLSHSPKAWKSQVMLDTKENIVYFPIWSNRDKSLWRIDVPRSVLHEGEVFVESKWLRSIRAEDGKLQAVEGIDQIVENLLSIDGFLKWT